MPVLDFQQLLYIKGIVTLFYQFVMSSLLNGLTITQRTATFLKEQRTFCLSEQLISPTTSWHIFCKYPPNVFDANASCRLIHVVINPERIDIRKKVYQGVHPPMPA